MPYRCNVSIDFGCTAPAGTFPELHARYRPRPKLLINASAMIERHELPVHRTSTLSASDFISRNIRRFFQKARSTQALPSSLAYNTHSQPDQHGRRRVGHLPSFGMFPTECLRGLV